MEAPAAKTLVANSLPAADMVGKENGEVVPQNNPVRVPLSDPQGRK